MAKLLIVEDDPRIASFIERGHATEGHVLDVAGTGVAAMRMLRAAEYPLVILDRMLPDMDEVEVCRQLRQERIGCRVLMLAAKDGLGDKVGGVRRDPHAEDRRAPARPPKLSRAICDDPQPVQPWSQQGV